MGRQTFAHLLGQSARLPDNQTNAPRPAHRLCLPGAHPSRTIRANTEGLTVRDISTQQNVSHNHLVKVVNELCRHGILTSSRGRNGGIRLAWHAKEINVGRIVRLMETEGDVISSCAPPQGRPCILVEACRFRCLTREATNAFMAILDGMTLHDLLS
ncbi:RrF2 family transcriptional regulator [Komagataeibacter europaeus]|uniref:RrF2 family transcriptional regulator n=1 Tax=Komagataeibacter europaeus TaxID=33995 RepID=UPI001F244A68|nr:Rrf2 family transcriptional regulator [Komagataeibacter europaeus]